MSCYNCAYSKINYYDDGWVLRPTTQMDSNVIRVVFCPQCGIKLSLPTKEHTHQMLRCNNCHGNGYVKTYQGAGSGLVDVFCSECCGSGVVCCAAVQKR